MAAVLRDPELTTMVRHHHERLDGSGYPDGLVGEEIPLGARIIAVADTFDAITSGRPYKAASPHKKAIDILREEAGTRLDPAVVRAFCGHYAGRRPLAVWAFLANLPERVLSWLGGSVASVASSAKVVAVAALVGGVAATSSTLGLAPAKHHRLSTASGSSLASRAQGAESASVSASTAAGARADAGAGLTAKRRRAGRGHHTAPLAVARGEASASGISGAQPTAPSTAGVGSNQTTGQAGSEGASAGKGESPSKAGGGEAPATGNGESPSKGKTEEAPATGKGESPSKGKGEEAPAKSEPSTKVEEVHGKTEEATGKVKEVVKEVAKEVVKEVHGKVEEVTAVTKEVLGKLK
jgi:uncharacterized protein YjbJ (UPF0337 family)